MNSITVRMLARACNLSADTVWWAWVWFTRIPAGPFPRLGLRVAQKELCCSFHSLGLNRSELWQYPVFNVPLQKLSLGVIHTLSLSLYSFYSWD